MTTTQMHENEVPTDSDLVRRLLAAQFPRWVDLPIAAVPSAGTDNALYRLGDAMVVRLPRIHWAAGQVAKEQRWLPVLAPQLPLAIPAPLAMGAPGEGYPWHWSVYRWLQGDPAHPDDLADSRHAARDLARFIVALRQIDATGGPASGAPNSGRGVPLATRDAYTRTAIAELGERIDTAAVLAAWEAALDAPVWADAPVWIHGDLSAGNLLLRGGHLHAVIDFGCLGVGDPAVDLIIAWSVFNAATREVFRAEMGADDATWARGRGWALSVALVALPYYWDTNAVLVASARRAIAALLGEE